MVCISLCASSNTIIDRFLPAVLLITTQGQNTVLLSDKKGCTSGTATELNFFASSSFIKGINSISSPIIWSSDNLSNSIMRFYLILSEKLFFFHLNLTILNYFYFIVE